MAGISKMNTAVFFVRLTRVIFLFCIVLSFRVFSISNWFSNAWQSRLPIQIEGSAVTGTLTNYPALVYLSNSSNLLAGTRFNGSDLVFTASDMHTRLSFEVESYSNGSLCAWVCIPLLQSGVNQDIYLYYSNNAQTTSLADTTNVWDSDYLLVQHMHNTNIADSVTNFDSTASNHFSTNTTAASSVTVRTNGIAGWGNLLNGTSGYMRVPNSSSLYPATFTFEAWVNRTSVTTTAALLGLNVGTAYPAIYDLWTVSSKNGIFYLNGSWYHHYYNTEISSDMWIYYAYTIPSDAILEVAIYRNGSALTPYSPSTANGATATKSAFVLGSIGTAYFFPGFFDEVRYSKTVRSAAYFATVYANLSSPTNFRTVGNAEDRVQLKAYPETHPAGYILTFSNLSRIFSTNAITNSKFVFGNGQIIEKQGANALDPATNSFSVTNRVYTNWLEVTDITGTTQSNSQVIRVYAYVEPEVNFTIYPGQPVIRQNVMFVDASRNNSAPFASWSINTGDGKIITIDGTHSRYSASYTYGKAGTYNVVLTVSDTVGETYTKAYALKISDYNARKINGLENRIYSRAADLPIALKYSLKNTEERVYIRVMNMEGMLIRDLGIAEGTAGTDVLFLWDGRDWLNNEPRSGPYLLRVQILDAANKLDDFIECVVLY